MIGLGGTYGTGQWAFVGLFAPFLGLNTTLVRTLHFSTRAPHTKLTSLLYSCCGCGVVMYVVLFL